MWSLKYSYFGYLIVGAAGIGAGAALITNFSPHHAPGYVLIGLYASVFAFVFGLAGVVGNTIRFLFRSQVIALRRNPVTARQSALLGLLAVAALYVQSFRLLNVYTAVLLVIVFSILELLFLIR